jgi:heterodisulfide reductase subunit C
MDACELTSAAERNRKEIHALEEKSGVNLKDCYQCGKCSAGCPVAFAMDKSPRQIIRLLQLGLLEEALAAHTPWLCATCQTCYSRCPKDVDLPSLMEAVRQAGKKKGIIPEKGSNIFNDIFLSNVKTFGRSPEVILSALYNLKSGHLFQDVDSVPHLFLSGKAHVMPERVKNMDAIKKIFAKSLEGGDHS